MNTAWQIIESDCIDALREMDEASIDAIVCDPPYSLGFMGKAWDCDFDHTWTPEALRVLKPGGHLLAFGGTRTYHRLACAIEDAGFEIRDCLAWLYGSGFPKSLDVSKAIDKAAGAEREVVGRISKLESYGPNEVYGSGPDHGGEMAITAPATPEAAEWQGWGTALKPAHEPIVLARKPLTGTVAGNVLAHGTGALNVDGCRVGTGEDKIDGGCAGKTALHEGGISDRAAVDHSVGRWPANVVLDESAARLLDEQSGERGASGKASGPTLTGESTSNSRGKFNGVEDTPFYGDTGGASRFFYVAKASQAERNAGLDEPARNLHPTVKPIALMRWLCRLVTPPGGTILDPFAGSGTTGCAAVLEDFDFIGVERESKYVAIARARVAHWAAQPKQLGLFG